jgi:Na+:H+ antiporter, NhaA family
VPTRHPPVEGSWSAGPSPVARRLAIPLREFLDTEAAGGLVLLAATGVALGWANSPWSPAYEALWGTELAVEVGRWTLALDLRHWVNDGLMALFFFVVGWRSNASWSPASCAGCAPPPCPWWLRWAAWSCPPCCSWHSIPKEDRRGWGIPMATDIAFAVGVLALFGARDPAGLKLLLLSVAIVDDIGAILVIAVVYSAGLGWGPLAAAVGLLAAIAVLHRVGVVWWPVHVLLGVGVWLATDAAGVGRPGAVGADPSAGAASVGLARRRCRAVGAGRALGETACAGDHLGR